MTQASVPVSKKTDGKSASLALGPVREIVALVPGFLGFERIGGFAYFADHIAATLRAALEVTRNRRTPVVALSTPPAGSLAARQQAVIEQLSTWRRLYDPQHIHLVAHSSGGVDAYFLTGKRTLAGTNWTAEQDETRRRIASITAMATPFLGTSLSDSEVARFFAGSGAPPSLRTLSSLAVATFRLLWENEQSLAWAADIASGLPAATALLRQLSCHRELIGDLSPKRMCERYDELERDHHPKLTCYASYVQPPAASDASSLFLRLYGYTAEGADKPAGREHMELNKKLLESAAIIGAAGKSRVVLDAASNDGVVNTLRQLPPGIAADEVGGLVIADHADLLGYFDRYDPIQNREHQLSIFRSGATFRDDQFFELFDDVTRRLL